jgi:hypothetical protein
MNMLRLQRKFTRVFDKMLSKQSLNAGTVTLVWDSAPAPGSTMDESTYTGSGIQTEDAPALVHYVSASTVMRQGTGFQSGDAIVSFSPRTVLSSRRNLYFILRSRTKLARCATTAASKVVTCLDTAGIEVGAIVTGLQVPFNASVASVDSATQFTLSVAAAGTTSGQVFTADVLKEYLQAQTGRGIEEFWDVTFGDRKATTTILLRLRGKCDALPVPETGDEIRIVDADGTAVAYGWNGAAFSPKAGSGARAEIVPLTDGMELRIRGATVARFTATRGLVAASFSDTLSTDSPRIEFRIGGVCVATLTADGEFGAVDEISDGPEPADGMAFRDALGRWLFTISATAITAPLLTAD